MASNGYGGNHVRTALTFFLLAAEKRRHYPVGVFLARLIVEAGTATA